MPYGVPYGGRGGGRAAQRPGSRRRARGGAVSAGAAGGCLLTCFTQGGLAASPFFDVAALDPIELSPQAYRSV